MKPINKSTMFNALDDMRKAMTVEDYPVTGFDFLIDDDNFFNPYCLESANIAGYPFRSGMDNVNGFFYLSEEYEVYLAVLIETGKEHPANTEGLQWVKAKAIP